MFDSLCLWDSIIRCESSAGGFKNNNKKNKGKRAVEDANDQPPSKDVYVAILAASAMTKNRSVGLLLLLLPGKLFIKMLTALLMMTMMIIPVWSKPSIVLEQPRDGQIFEGASISVALAIMRGSSHHMEDMLDLCACLSYAKQDDKESWYLDSREPELFTSSFSTVNCYPVKIEGGGHVTRAPLLTIKTGGDSGGGWYGLSATLYQGEGGCHHNKKSDLISYSQSVVYLSGEGDELEESAVCEDSIGLVLPVGGGFGWGTVGLHFATSIVRSSRKVIYFERVHGGTMARKDREELRDSLDASARYLRKAGSSDGGGGGGGNPSYYPFLVIHALGKFGGELDTVGKLFSSSDSDSKSPVGSTNVGIIFSEVTSWTEEDIERLKFFDRLYAGSEWNAEVLRNASVAYSGNGAPLDIGIFSQGVDKELWASRKTPRRGAPRDDHDFVIFSGGKLEKRKGQDIVIDAFKTFSRLHSNARLMIAWQNDWDETVKSLETSKLVRGIPRYNAAKGGLEILEWLEENGIRQEQVIDLGRPGQEALADALAVADAAVFPSRCEGGTNLLAMESIASGVPTILSNNTGHLDLSKRICRQQQQDANAKKDEGCLVLSLQKENEAEQGWMDSSPQELANLLEALYGDRSLAEKVGDAGQKRIWTWGEEVDRVIRTGAV